MKSRYFMPLLVSTTFGLALWHFLVLQSFPSNHNILCPEAQTVYVKEILSVDNEVSGNFYLGLFYYQTNYFVIDQKCSSKRNITRNLSQTAVIILFISAILYVRKSQ